LRVGERIIEHFGKRLRLVFGVLIDDLAQPNVNVSGESITAVLPAELAEKERGLNPSILITTQRRPQILL
jgi:hypothetical protein